MGGKTSCFRRNCVLKNLQGFGHLRFSYNRTTSVCAGEKPCKTSNHHRSSPAVKWEPELGPNWLGGGSSRSLSPLLVTRPKPPPYHETSAVIPLSHFVLEEGKKIPTPKTRFSIWTLLRTPGRTPTCVFYHKMSVVRPFSVLSKDEIGPLQNGPFFLVKLKSWGLGSCRFFQLFSVGAKKSTQIFSVQSFSRALRVMGVRAENRGRPHPKSALSCGPGDGRNFLNPGHPSVRVRNVCRKFRPQKFMFMLCFLPWFCGPLLSVKMANRNPKTGLGGVVSQKNSPLGASHEIVPPIAL